MLASGQELEPGNDPRDQAAGCVRGRAKSREH